MKGTPPRPSPKEREQGGIAAGMVSAWLNMSGAEAHTVVEGFSPVRAFAGTLGNDEYPG